MRTMTISSGISQSAASGRADLLIQPETNDIGLLEWHQIDRAREAGRVATRAAMQQIIDLVQR